MILLEEVARPDMAQVTSLFIQELLDGRIASLLQSTSAVTRSPPKLEHPWRYQTTSLLVHLHRRWAQAPNPLVYFMPQTADQRVGLTVVSFATCHAVAAAAGEANTAETSTRKFCPSSFCLLIFWYFFLLLLVLTLLFSHSSVRAPEAGGDGNSNNNGSSKECGQRALALSGQGCEC